MEGMQEKLHKGLALGSFRGEGVKDETIQAAGGVVSEFVAQFSDPETRARAKEEIGSALGFLPANAAGLERPVPGEAERST